MAIERIGEAEPGSRAPAQPALLTFLIADVRGYTRFTVERGDEAAAKLTSRFGTIVADVVGRHAGEVVSLRGDEGVCVFSSARNSLRAAVALQVAFNHATGQDPSLPLGVGIGLDAGEAIALEGDYRGGALNLAARLCSIAGPGEVFCSEGVIHLARKTDGIAFVDRGEVALKGLSGPIRVIQIAPEGTLPAELPTLQPILVTRPTNLPDESTPFVGREREIEEIARLFRDPHIRLVTLTGPGGTGKTRLALQVGTTLLHDFRDGVFFVSLASLSDPTLVTSAIAEVLGVKEEPGSGFVDALIENLSTKHLLLVLDNFEHLLASWSIVARLLDACRELHVLVTSRSPLHLAREREYAVPPLSVPKPGHLPDPDALSQFEGVALFIERARAVKHDFAVTNENAPAVAEVCYRLDGLPLAIELAAARIRLFPPQALLQRLSSRLQLLTGGAKDRPTRQQTLRGAIDWSYSLLSKEEQLLFARLGVFVGGCTFEAAEAVCNPEGEVDLLEGLESLVNNSLVRQEGEAEPRFAMLDTIREYAKEKLAGSGQEETVCASHAQYQLALATEVGPTLRGPAVDETRRRLDAELDNLRAARSWLPAHGRVTDALCLVARLRVYWLMRGLLGEARRALEEGLTQGSDVEPGVRAEALATLGNLAMWQGELEAALQPSLEALRLTEDLGDRAAGANILSDLGALYRRHGEYERAIEVYKRSLQQHRELGEVAGARSALAGLGATADEQGEYEEAKAWFEEALALSRAQADAHGVAGLTNSLGIVALHQGNVEEAARRLEEALGLSRKLGLTIGVAYTLTELGNVETRLGAFATAAERFREALLLAREMGDKLLSLAVLGGMAELSAANGEADRAALLGAAEETQRDTLKIPLPPVEAEGRRRALDTARAETDPAIWSQSSERGRALSLDGAISYALGEAG